MSEDLIYVPPIVPVFPLPNAVLFPHKILPLHMFEPRYRAMTADAIEGNGILTVALLKPGWEPLYHTPRAPIHETIGVGRIIQHRELEDGNFNVLLRGIGRAVILDEVPDQPYRMVRIEPLETYSSAGDDGESQLRHALFSAVEDSHWIEDEVREQWLSLRDQAVPLGDIVDVFAAGIPADAELQQCMLGEPDAIVRGRVVLQQLRTIAAIQTTHRRARTEPDHHLN
jgi:Lon protease-like protein